MSPQVASSDVWSPAASGELFTWGGDGAGIARPHRCSCVGERACALAQMLVCPVVERACVPAHRSIGSRRGVGPMDAEAGQQVGPVRAVRRCAAVLHAVWLGSLQGKVVASVACGRSHTLVVADDRVYCWGKARYGQLGERVARGLRVGAFRMLCVMCVRAQGLAARTGIR